METIKLIPAYWSIILFVIMLIWNAAITFGEIKNMKNRLNEHDKEKDNINKHLLELSDKMICDNDKLEQMVNDVKEWSRQQISELTKLNSTTYVTRAEYSANQNAIIQRLDRIEDKIDRQWHSGQK